MNCKKLILILCCGVFLSVERNANAQTTATFNYVTNAVQTWNVPCGVTTVTVQLWGAGGGSGNQNGYSDAWCGGSGAYMEGTLTGLSGQILNLYVPQGGGYYTTNVNAPGGWPGGGTAGCDATYVEYGGAGGGYAAVQIGATYYAVAGAGGGGGSTGYGGTAYGGGGGNPNSTITVGSFGTNGGPGLLTSGGAGGSAYSVPGTAGTALTGGTGEPQSYNGDYGGGGGGAGWYGGGGGGDEGNAGGGGSSFPGSTYTSGGITFTIISNLAGTTNSATSGSAVAPGGPPAGIGSGNIGSAGGNGYVTLSWFPSSPVITPTVVSNVSCNGESNGSTHAAVSGGGAPYTYLWTPSSQTNATATGLTAGTYTISVSDACGHTASSSVAITQPAVLAASAATTSNVTCNGGSTGATGSTVTGGTSPYTYAWTGGSTNATATSLTAGSYTLSVTDMNGCSATASTVVTQPNALSDSAFAVNNVLCNGGNTGSASNIAQGGTMPYTYLWIPSGSTKDTASGLSAGTYTLMVSDACGASATTSATITQPTAISITSHSTPDNNGHGVGTAVVSVSGGVGPYTYLWTGGKTTDSIGGLTEGTYCVDVKDANGCKDSICVVVTKITNGIDGITSGSAQISVYPNPNNGQFTIESSIGGASTVEIYNILGEKVFARSLSTTKGTNTISVNQPNGVYLYRIISDNGDLLGEGRISIQK